MTAGEPRPAPIRWGVAAARLGLGIALVTAVLWLLLAGPQTLEFEWVPWALAVSLAGSLAANAVTAWRWQLLSETMTSTKLPYGVYFHHLATTRVIGQFLPSLVVDLLGRSASLRAAGSRDTVGRLVVPLVLERILDLVLPCVLLGWALALQQGLVTDTTAWTSLAIVTAAFVALAIPTLGPMTRVALRVRAWAARVPDPAVVVPEVQRALAVRITVLSLGRWLTVMVQYWGAGAALGVTLPALVLLAAAPLAQLAALVGITPGALGLQEGGWAGALTLLGIAASDIAVFVIATRAAMIVNFAIIAALSWRWRGGDDQRADERGSPAR